MASRNTGWMFGMQNGLWRWGEFRIHLDLELRMNAAEELDFARKTFYNR